MTTEQDYVELTQRTERLMRQHAVLEAQEKDKETRRAAITKALLELGVDPTQPEKELARLEAEAAEALREATQRVDEFERLLANPNKAEALHHVNLATANPAENAPSGSPAPEATTADPNDIDI